MLRINEYPVGCVSTVAWRHWSLTASLFNAHVQCRTIGPTTATRHTVTTGDVGIRITGMFRQRFARTDSASAAQISPLQPLVKQSSSVTQPNGPAVVAVHHNHGPLSLTLFCGLSRRHSKAGGLVLPGGQSTGCGPHSRGSHAVGHAMRVHAHCPLRQAGVHPSSASRVSPPHTFQRASTLSTRPLSFKAGACVTPILSFTGIPILAHLRWASALDTPIRHLSTHTYCTHPQRHGYRSAHMVDKRAQYTPIVHLSRYRYYTHHQQAYCLRQRIPHLYAPHRCMHTPRLAQMSYPHKVGRTGGDSRRHLQRMSI